MIVFVRLVVGLLVATALQAGLTAVAPGLAGLVDPFVVVMVWVAVATTPMPAQVAGMVTGFARDVFTGRPFGLGGFAGTLIGYAVARFAQHLLVRQPRTIALVFALAAAAEQAIVAVLEIVLMGDPVIPAIDQVAIRVIATTMLGVVWYNSEHALLRAIARWRRERGGRLRLG